MTTISIAMEMVAVTQVFTHEYILSDSVNMGFTPLVLNTPALTKKGIGDNRRLYQFMSNDSKAGVT
jgi:hypothetical protein